MTWTTRADCSRIPIWRLCGYKLWVAKHCRQTRNPASRSLVSQ